MHLPSFKQQWRSLANVILKFQSFYPSVSKPASSILPCPSRTNYVSRHRSRVQQPPTAPTPCRLPLPPLSPPPRLPSWFVTPGRAFKSAPTPTPSIHMGCMVKNQVKKPVCVLLRDQFSIRLWSPPVLEELVSPCCKVTMVMDHLERYPRTKAFRLGRDASLVFTEPNAGGQSVVSEALSMEYMHQLFGAVDVVTEMQIEYWSPNWKKVDYLCTIQSARVAVSVTRAMKFRRRDPFTESDAKALLRKKLYGLVVAKSGVSAAQRYAKSILHIWCQTKLIADKIAACYQAIVAELDIEDNVILMATVTQDEGIFSNDVQLVQTSM
ncbi:hypothetical protein AC1031_010743 [Aphanomyces cochlioides]|nr:hypothetical protein AC1031_010743 [Aphanomyces cochlioides]